MKTMKTMKTKKTKKTKKFTGTKVGKNGKLEVYVNGKIVGLQG